MRALTTFATRAVLANCHPDLRCSELICVEASYRRVLEKCMCAGVCMLCLFFIPQQLKAGACFCLFRTLVKDHKKHLNQNKPKPAPKQGSKPKGGKPKGGKPKGSKAKGKGAKQKRSQDNAEALKPKRAKASKRRQSSGGNDGSWWWEVAVMGHLG